MNAATIKALKSATLRMLASHAVKDFAPVAAGDSSRLPSLNPQWGNVQPFMPNPGPNTAVARPFG
jgi:hypothetical protein